MTTSSNCPPQRQQFQQLVHDYEERFSRVHHLVLTPTDSTTLKTWTSQESPNFASGPALQHHWLTTPLVLSRLHQLVALHQLSLRYLLFYLAFRDRQSFFLAILLSAISNPALLENNNNLLIFLIETSRQLNNVSVIST